MNRPLVFLTATLVALSVAAARADVDELVAPGAEPVQLATGFHFCEGPAADRHGGLYFTDGPPARTIHYYTPGGVVELYREESGWADGLDIDRDGRVIACEVATRRVTAHTTGGQTLVLAERYGGGRLNAPNDCWVDPCGGIYFTDPCYACAGPLEQDGEHLYYLLPERDGASTTVRQIIRVDDDLVRPNGVIGTPDGRILYVADEGDHRIYRYRIEPGGGLADRALFAEHHAIGLTLDEHGNLYAALGPVTVFAPDGRRLGEIAFPEQAVNLTFGGPDRDRLMVTAMTSLYALEMQVRGPVRGRCEAAHWQRFSSSQGPAHARTAANIPD